MHSQGCGYFWNVVASSEKSQGFGFSSNFLSYLLPELNLSTWKCSKNEDFSVLENPLQQSLEVWGLLQRCSAPSLTCKHHLWELDMTLAHTSST